MKQVTIIAICLYINGQIMKYSFSFIVKYYTNSPFNDRAKWVKSCNWIIASKAPTVSSIRNKRWKSTRVYVNKICLLSIFIFYQNTYQKIHFWTFQVNVGLLRYFIIISFKKKIPGLLEFLDFFKVYNYRPTEKQQKQKGNLKKKMALFWDILSNQEAKFQIWYLSEFLIVLWPKYVTLNKTTLRIHKKGQTKFFVKISIGLCAQIW